MGCEQSTTKPTEKKEEVKVETKVEEHKNKEEKVPDGVEDKKKPNVSNMANSKLQTLIDEAIKIHNEKRSYHGVGPLTHDLELSKKAQAYAESLAEKDTMEHSDCKWGDKKVGENLAMCMGQPMTGKFMTDMWYDEIKDYNFNNPGFSSETGHFTQVVWKDTKTAGFGMAKAKSGNIYGVGNYYPAGNFNDDFENNVPRLV